MQLAGMDRAAAAEQVGIKKWEVLLLVKIDAPYIQLKIHFLNGFVQPIMEKLKTRLAHLTNGSVVARLCSKSIIKNVRIQDLKIGNRRTPTATCLGDDCKEVRLINKKGTAEVVQQTIKIWRKVCQLRLIVIIKSTGPDLVQETRCWLQGSFWRNWWTRRFQVSYGEKVTNI